MLRNKDKFHLTITLPLAVLGLLSWLVITDLAPKLAVLVPLVFLILSILGIITVFSLKCPSCGEYVCRPKNGAVTFWPGSRCRFCDAEY